MVRICAWCGKVIGTKPPLKDTTETHGICDACFKEETEQVKKEGRKG